MYTFILLSGLIFGVIFIGNLIAAQIEQIPVLQSDYDLSLDGIFFHW